MFGSWLDLLFPPKCAVCQKEDAWVCESCLKSFLLTPIVELSHHRPFSRIIGAGRYQEPVLKESIHQLKYASVIGYATVLAALLVQRLPSNIFTDAVLIPVPLHVQRFRERGFNQAEAIARAIAKEIEIELFTNVIRTRYTPPQVVQKTKKDRIQNISHSFAATKDTAIIRDKSVIILDDVITTGSTIGEVARCIQSFRPRHIIAVAVAIDE